MFENWKKKTKVVSRIFQNFATIFITFLRGYLPNNHLVRWNQYLNVPIKQWPNLSNPLQDFENDYFVVYCNANIQNFVFSTYFPILNGCTTFLFNNYNYLGHLVKSLFALFYTNLFYRSRIVTLNFTRIFIPFGKSSSKQSMRHRLLFVLLTTMTSWAFKVRQNHSALTPVIYVIKRMQTTQAENYFFHSKTDKRKPI